MKEDKNVRSDGVRPEGYNKYYTVSAMWYRISGGVAKHKLKCSFSRGNAITLVKHILKRPNTITVTIALENEYVPYQEKTFEGPAYGAYYAENN